MQGLSIVQCAALVNTNHGIVNLIMNEYSYSRQAHTIDFSGQIDWYNNFVDDKSTQHYFWTGGTITYLLNILLRIRIMRPYTKQRIIIIDGYIMPLVSKGGHI